MIPSLIPTLTNSVLNSAKFVTKQELKLVFMKTVRTPRELPTMSMLGIVLPSYIEKDPDIIAHCVSLI